MIRLSTRPARRSRTTLGSALLLSLLGLAGHPAAAAHFTARAAVVPARTSALPAGLAAAVAQTLPRGANMTTATWSQQAEITQTGTGFANTVSVSENTALVAASAKRHGQGAVYVFVRSGSTWTEQAVLTASNLTFGSQFGESLALSGDTALVGAPMTLNPPQGAVYAFVRHGSSWTQQAVLTSSDGTPNDSFGWSVALSGTTALIGAPDRNNLIGAAYVFVRGGKGWTQQAELTLPTGTRFDYFGSSVSVDGDTALVGAPGRNGGLVGIGAAYVFVRRGTMWSQQAQLTGSDAVTDDRDGNSVALSGNTALIGAYYRNNQTGAAYIFVRSGTTWTQQAKLTASDGLGGDWFGYALALSGDTALIGSPLHGVTGVAYVYARRGTTWSQQAELISSDGGIGDELGNTVALSSGTAVLGAPGKSFGNGGKVNGAAYVFVRSGASSTAGLSPAMRSEGRLERVTSATPRS